MKPKQTVGDLILELQKFDPNLPVYVYDNTEEVWAGRLFGEVVYKFPYCKADPPSDFVAPTLVLFGNEY